MNAECAEVRRERGDLFVAPDSGCRRCGLRFSPGPFRKGRNLRSTSLGTIQP